MEQIYCIYYRNSNIYSMNPRIIGYYTDLNIAEKHLRKIRKLYREKKYIARYKSDTKTLVVKDVATYTIQPHEINKIEIFNIE